MERSSSSTTTYKNYGEGKREAFLRSPIVDPAQPEQGPVIYARSDEAFQEHKRRRVLDIGSTPNNPLLGFLPIARKVLSQAELEEAITQRPQTDYRINLSKRGRYSTRPEQQQQLQVAHDVWFIYFCYG